MKSRIRGTLKIVRRGEWFRLTAGLVHRCVPSCIAKLDDLCLLACHTTPGETSILPSAYVFARASSSDMDDLIKLSADADNSKFNQLFLHFDASGHECFVVKTSGKVLAYCWIFCKEYTLTYDSYQKTNIRIPLNNHLCVIGNLLVHPESRGKGMGTALLSHVITQLRSSDSNLTILSFVNSNNEISIRMHQNLGFSIVGRYYYFASLLGRYMLIRSLVARTKLYRITRNCVVDLIRL
jgi:ribosomal protein S18 acetylase RimI-like enzyme